MNAIKKKSFQKELSLSKSASLVTTNNEHIITESDSCIPCISHDIHALNHKSIFNEDQQQQDESIQTFSIPKQTQQIDSIETQNSLTLNFSSFNFIYSNATIQIPFKEKKQTFGRTCSSNYRNIKTDSEGINQQQSKFIQDYQEMKLSSVNLQILEAKNTLVSLNLSFNCFVCFPEELCSFIMLRQIKFDHNLIQELPEQIAFLKHLEELSLSHNYLKQLPGSLQNISMLKILNVGQNNIQQIGNEVTNLKKLEILYIFNNQFTKIPVKLKNLSNLNQFGLDWFRYIKPSIDSIICKPFQNQLFTKLNEIYSNFHKDNKTHISFKDFIYNFSQTEIDLTEFDSRGRNWAFLSAENEELGVFKAILQEDAQNINLIDKEGQTILTVCLIENKFRSIDFLLQNGSDPRKGGGFLGSTLHIAVSRLNESLVQKFLQMNVDPNSVDSDGNTPLHIIFNLFSKDPIKAHLISHALLHFQADPNIFNRDLWAPLHLAVKKNQRDAIKFAIQYNKQAKGKLFNFERRGGVNKWSGVHLAANQGNIGMLDLLSEANCNLFGCTKFNQTPRKVALQSLVLFKILRKQENRWISKNLLSQQFVQNSNIQSNNLQNQKQDEDNKCIQNLRGLIAETMKKKEFFLQQQLDLFDDQQFGYSIKENMLNNHALNPRNKENGYDSQEEAISDPDDTNEELILISKQQSNLSENIMENIDECCSGNNSNLNIQNKIVEKNTHTNGKQQLQSSVFLNNIQGIINNMAEIDAKSVFTNKQLKEEHKIIVDIKLKSKENQNMNTNKIFGNIQALQIDNFLEEILKLNKNIFLNSSIFNDKIHSLNLLSAIHIRMTQKQMKFISEKNILPRNIHIMNEYMHLQLSSTVIQDFFELIPTKLLQITKDLLNNIKLLPIINRDQGLLYQQYCKRQQTNRNNQQNILLILHTIKILNQINNFDYQAFYNKTFSETLLPRIHLYYSAFFTSEYSNLTYLQYESYQNMQYLKKIQSNIQPYQKNIYRIVGRQKQLCEESKFIQKSQRIFKCQQKNENQPQSIGFEYTWGNIDNMPDFIQLNQTIEEPTIQLENYYSINYKQYQLKIQVGEENIPDEESNSESEEQKDKIKPPFMKKELKYNFQLKK